MTNTIKVLCFVLLFFTTVTAQNKNHVFLELFGNGGYYSVNYERNIVDNFHVRVGFSYVAHFLFSSDFVSIPVLVNYHLNTKKSDYFEFGIGATHISSKGSGFLGELFNADGFIATGVVGYAFHPIEDNLSLRLAYIPFIDPYDNRINSFIGLSVGFKF